MLNQKYAEASVEVLDILNHMDVTDISKVSKKFINFLKENASKDYIAKLDYSKELNDMELKEETRGLLTLMYEKYWCPEEEKANLQKIFLENEKKYQEELREKYNPDNLFRSKEVKFENIENSVAMVEYKESFLTKIKNWFKRTF